MNNYYYIDTSKKKLSARDLPDWMLAHGIVSATTRDIAGYLSIPEGQVRQRMAMLRKRGEMVSPSRGLWVPVPPQYRTWGAPPPMAYIDSIMNHLGVAYCVGWLSAASIHGAGHQAAQVFQVAVGSYVADRTVGRSRLEFPVRDYVDKSLFSRMSTVDGSAFVATPAATMLMLASDFDLAAGPDNAVTVIVELYEQMEDWQSEAIASIAPSFSASAMQRLGWILSQFNDKGAPDSLREYCRELRPSKAYLDAGCGTSGRHVADWNLVVNRAVEPDL